MGHLVTECKNLAPKECKRRHDKAERIIQWKLCEFHQLQRKEKSAMNMHQKVLCKMMK